MSHAWSVLSLNVVRFVLKRGPFCPGRGPFCPWSVLSMVRYVPNSLSMVIIYYLFVCWWEGERRRVIFGVGEWRLCYTLKPCSGSGIDSSLEIYVCVCGGGGGGGGACYQKLPIQTVIIDI